MMSPDHDDNSSELRFVVVTKNSARWFGIILDGYRAAGIKPFVILDDASTDGTEKLLVERGIAYAREYAELPRVEALIRRIPARVDSRWIVRLDDDELPSRGLCDWIAARLGDLTCSVVGFQRRSLRLNSKGCCEYSRHPLIVSRLGVLDAQWRMFKANEMRYITDIHTPGFVVPKGSPIAPQKAYIAHFDWLVRGLSERRLQIEAYDRQVPNAGTRFRDVKAWEDSDETEHGFHSMETDEFDAIAARLAATI
jgi:glycosyltransferase involved in cell wall biosynthesis